MNTESFPIEDFSQVEVGDFFEVKKVWPNGDYRHERFEVSWCDEEVVQSGYSYWELVFGGDMTLTKARIRGPIDFEDIRVGDLIEATTTYNDYPDYYRVARGRVTDKRSTKLAVEGCLSPIGKINLVGQRTFVLKEPARVVYPE